MKELRTIVEALSEKLISAGSEQLSVGAIKADKVLVQVPVFEKFEYNEEGYVSAISSIQNKYIDSWRRASLKVLEISKVSSEFKQCEEIFKYVFPEVYIKRQQLQNLGVRILEVYFGSEGIDSEKKVQSFTDKYVAEINGAEVHFELFLHLNGIALGPEPTYIEHNMILRRPLKQDFETIQTPFGNVASQQIPSAILQISSLGDFRTIPPVEPDKYCSIFRLFGVAPVNYLSYELFCSSSILLFLPKAFGQFVPSTGLKYLSINKNTEDKLKQFYKDLEFKVNKLISQSSQDSFLRIAFDRYNEALLESTIFERKIANAIMAFEALFSNKELEIAYSLSILVGKFFSYFAKSSAKIREEIKLAYDIRSKFAHGEVYKGKKLEKLRENYGSENEFLKQILEYLRISIVIFLFCQFDKKVFVKKLDDSILDNDIAAELKLEIAEALPYIIAPARIS